MTMLGSPNASVAAGDALRRIAAGHRADLDDALALVTATGADREALFTTAGALRDDGLASAGRPRVITYSRKVFVPLTTLCRDRCHYCIFVDTPGQLQRLHKPVYMSPEQVLHVLRQGQALGCKEALLTLGDRPEERWPDARAWLDEHGFASTLDYVGYIARLITAETGLLAHLNPGVMSASELDVLRPVAPSMGMMLETTSRRLYEEPGQPHYASPDKDPAVRLQVIEDAGAAGIPFTTGILVGIGETARDRAESLLALRDAQERHGHIQEVIVQNFRAKPRTAMQDVPDADLLEYATVVAAARAILGPRMRIQVPPNLSDPAEFELLVRAGIDDWGGVSPLTADHVNPERPWPQIDELAARTAALGYELRERLTAHPEYVRDAGRWVDPALHDALAALADPQDGLARPGAPSSPAPAASGAGLSEAGPSASAGAAVRPSEAGGAAATTTATKILRTPSARVQGEGVEQLVSRAADAPGTLDDHEWVALLEATGSGLETLVRAADDQRRYTIGEAVSIVVNRNLTSTGFRAGGATGPAEFDLAEAAAIAADARELGVTEICVQGMLPAAEDPRGYLDLARALTADGGIHLHAYRPQDVCDLADRSGLGLEAALAALREAGVSTVPGTGVKVLAERVRGIVAPTDLHTDRWVEAITAAHRAGFHSTSVLFYGHAETAAERIAHLQRLRAIQEDTGGFTEFVPIPLPGPQGGVPLVAERSALDEHRAMVAVSRLLLAGSIRHIQIPWTRHDRDTTAALLQAGGDDLGGTLLDGRVRPAAGIEQGNELPLDAAARLVRPLFRPLRRRSTDYGEVAT